MQLTRSTLLSAIRMGLRLSQGKPPDAQAEKVLEAIDMAIEIQGGVPAVESPGLDNSPVTFEAPPPNPESVSQAPEVVPEPLAPPSMIHVATDHTANQEIEKLRVKKANGLKVKSLFLGGSKNRVTLADLMNWAASNFPMTIKIIPLGRTEPVELQRKLYTIPLSGEPQNREKESTIKIAYHHPSLDQTMEVGSSIRVGDVQEEFPNRDELLKAIAEQGRQLYRLRPQRIEGAAPGTPPLEQQHRLMMSKKPGVDITFGDADEVAGARVL